MNNTLPLRADVLAHAAVCAARHGINVSRYASEYHEASDRDHKRNLCRWACNSRAKEISETRAVSDMIDSLFSVSRSFPN